MLAVSNAMVIGDRRKYLCMLVSLKTEVDLETMLPNDRLAADALFVGKQIGSTATLYSEAVKDPLWKAYIDKGVKTANRKTTSNAQIVQKWRWLPKDFSEKEGDLTPTLKLKRNVVSKKYADYIEAIYAEDTVEKFRSLHLASDDSVEMQGRYMHSVWNGTWMQRVIGRYCLLLLMFSVFLGEVASFQHHGAFARRTATLQVCVS